MGTNKFAGVAARAVLASTLALGMVSAAAAAELLVYTAIEADQLESYKQAFEADNPGITINWVRDSTGIVTAKLLAEKDNPQADVVWGLAATSLMLLADEGMLLGYAPAGLDKINPKFRDGAVDPTWVGMDVWSSAICFNTVEGGAKGVAAPASWQDLTKPEYAGMISMPNPSSSGTGYLMVSAWLQLMGEEKGWEYMDALHENVGAYTHSGSKPCRQAGAGEFPIGISFEYRASKTKEDGAPIDIIFPTEGIGWDMEATAILKTSKNLDAAKALADWAASETANEMYSAGYAIVAIDGIAQPLEYVPANLAEMLIDNDFTWAAQNRERILEEWTVRYDSKSEPRS